MHPGRRVLAKFAAQSPKTYPELRDWSAIPLWARQARIVALGFSDFATPTDAFDSPELTLYRSTLRAFRITNSVAPVSARIAQPKARITEERKHQKQGFDRVWILGAKLKGQPCFRPGNCLASLSSVSFLPMDHVEPDLASQSVILIHTSVAGKVGS
jgi:hypothetical protein